MIALQKPWKMLFVSSKKVFSFLRNSNSSIFISPSFSPCQPYEKSGVAVFTLKKAKIWNIDKKCFSVLTKNLNWEILTKNLVVVKGGMGS